jgi:hypothetical protein
MKQRLICLSLFAGISIIVLACNLPLPAEKQGAFYWYILYIPMIISLFGIFGAKITVKNILIWTAISIPVFLFLFFDFNLIIAYKLLAVIIGGALSVAFLWLIQKIRITKT